MFNFSQLPLSTAIVNFSNGILRNINLKTKKQKTQSLSIIKTHYITLRVQTSTPIIL